MNKKKVIITGVTGQTGSYMAEFLLKHTDVEVYGAARRTSSSHFPNLDDFISNPRFHLVSMDLGDSQSVDNLVAEIKPDYFINLAAQSFVGISWDMPEYTFEIDAVGVIRCLESIRKHVPDCRFYNAGSSEEFGDVQFTPQNENHPYRARSPYGAAKIAARQIVKVYRDSYHLYAVQGLLFNHESERRGPEFVTRKITMGVARIKKALDKGESFEPLTLGNLDSMRDWSHAQDFVLGIWLMLNQDETTFWNVRESKNPTERKRRLAFNLKEYILASGECHSIREFVELAFKEAGVVIKNVNPDKFPPSFNPNGVQVNYTTEEGVPLVVSSEAFYRPAEVDWLQGDALMARTLLAWNPLIPFPELVRRMVVNDLRLLEKP